MKKVVVVTDSCATVPPDLARQLDIRVVPITLTVDGRVYHDGVDITAGEVYRWQRARKQLPTTTAPSVGEFLHVYARAAETASGVVSIHLPPSLSATYAAAYTASGLIEGLPIRVLDSRSAAMAQGFVVLAAARAAAEGADLDEVVRRAEEVAGRVVLLAGLDTLEYLHRGGRIGGAAAWLGNALQIKPIVELVNSRVEPYARPRTWSKAMQVILARIAEVADSRPLHVAVLHADAPAEAEILRGMIAERFRCVDLLVSEFTPVMGVHTGPGVLGAAFYAE